MTDNLEEFEKFGAVALVGLLLVPGVAWILRARGGGIAVRAAVVGAVIAGALAAESAMDRTANAVTDGRTAA